MSAAEVLDALLRVNLAGGAAILGVICLRKTARAKFGARLAYGLWLLPALAGAAVLVPARQVVVAMPSAAPAIIAAARAHQTFLLPAHAHPGGGGVMSLDPIALLVGSWLVGVAAAGMIMALLQQRFMRQARAGALGPAVVGVIAPRIVTPRDFSERYSPQEQALVLAHEQAHIVRHDSRLNGLSAAAQCLCWFNPLVHLGAHLMRVDQELACDEAVVSRFPDARRAYAEVLVKAQLAVLPLPLGCYWPSKTQHPLVERVAMLKRKDIGHARRLAGAAALAALCTGSGLAAWAAQPAEVRVTAAPASGATLAQPPAAAANAPARAAADAEGGIKAGPKAPPAPAGAADGRFVVRSIRIDGANRVGDDVVLAVLAIAPGQTVTKATMDAAEKRMFGTGWFTDASLVLAPDGDLVVRVKEKPEAAKLLIADLPHVKPQANALASPITIAADALDRRGEDTMRWTGHVEVVFGVNHLMSDVLDVYAPEKVSLVFGKAPPPTGPEIPQGSGPKQMTAEGHVSYMSDDETVEADHAVYDLASGDITFTGNVVAVRSQTPVKDGKLVLKVKSGGAINPAATGPSTENAIRRWIVSVQMHQPDEAVMSPALIQAARQQQTMAAQTLRAFGSLKSVRFVRDMPEGVSNYEADFAHGKLNLMVGPLTADGKLDQLRWGPIWAKDGERPRPGVPLAP